MGYIVIVVIHHHRDGVVQVEPALTAFAFRAFQRLILKRDEPLSKLAFDFNLRPYTWASEGFRGFYRGIIPEYAKVVPGVSITYATYELMKRNIGVETGRL